MYDCSKELYHHGIKGQKWGVRRYQNSDGSLTEAGRRRYGYGTKADSMPSNKGHRKFANDALKTETKLNKQYNKAIKKNDTDNAKKLEKDIKQFNIDKNKAAKVLGMSAKELSYRDTEALYNRRVRRAALTGGMLAGPFGAMAGVVGSSFTTTGRAYAEAYDNAYAEYQEDKKRQVRVIV